MANRSGTRKRPINDENDTNDNPPKRKSFVEKEPSDVTGAPAVVTSAPWSTVSTEMKRLTKVVPKIAIQKLPTPEGCVHEVAVPETIEYKPLFVSKDPPAREYKFTLDPFQREAILCIENNQSVLVSAHTSAGKTVVAEYAIASSLRKKQRVIYTTPIKALSNQKFYEMKREFPNDEVGLMTGDITINEDASCLIMTTEILRSMLYRGSKITREMAWVVFDEIHYMRDKERGVVWEETIILLPDTVHYVFLSATIPNARQFAEWISYIHKQPCHVVYTDFRPTPLQHYIYPAGGDGMHLVVNENSVFQESNFNDAMKVLTDGAGLAKADERGRKGGFKNNESNCFKIVKLVMESNLAPVIIFSFSKRDCEDYAQQMSKLTFTTKAEEKLIEEIFQNAMNYTLSEDEKQLPQVRQILPKLRKGIGIHHSGLLPVLKEVVEILFSEGLIKALFATETFAMGLNMPARTVLFTHARKYDGKDFRWITSGEYIQMSGRAGRRGLDDKGTVILMLDEQIGSETAKQIIKGKPDPLLSAFRVTYSMVLNILRMQEINPEHILEKSFYHYQNYANISELTEKMKNLTSQYKGLMIEGEKEVKSYRGIRQQLQHHEKNLSVFINKPEHIKSFLKPGRLVQIANDSEAFGWCIVTSLPQSLKSSELQPKSDMTKVLASLCEIGQMFGGKEEVEEGNTTTLVKKDDVIFVVEVLACVSEETAGKRNIVDLKPSQQGGKKEMILVKVDLSVIVGVSSVCLTELPKDLKSPTSRMKALKMLKSVEKHFTSKLDLLDPVEDLQVNEGELKKLQQNVEDCKARLEAHPMHNDQQLQQSSKEYEVKLKLATDIEAVKIELKQHPYFLHIDELKRRKLVLQWLGYAKPGDVIDLKGQVACEISSGDEILLTELLFNGVFNNLTPEEACALLSCLVFQEKSTDQPSLTNNLSQIFHKMQDEARHVAKVSIDARLPLDEEKYVESFRSDMMEVVNSWCKGSSFSQICEITDIYEGSIIRCMRRLQETLLQMHVASKGVGNLELEKKFVAGHSMVKRNIVNACSLYLQKDYVTL